MIHAIETPHLFLRPLQLSDAEATERLFPHWEIVRYLTAQVPWPYPPGSALKNIRDKALPAMERGEEWHWSLFLKTAPSELIGRVSLHRDETDNRGFWMGLPWQGHRLMTEAVDAITAYWFDVLKFSILRAPKAVANEASRPHLATARNARHCYRRTRLCLRPPPRRNLGNHRRRMAHPPPRERIHACLSVLQCAHERHRSQPENHERYAGLQGHARSPPESV